MLNKSKVFALIVSCFLLIMCNGNEKSKEDKQTILKGNISLLVDETLTPIVEDQVEIFEDKYKEAKLAIKPKSENEIVNDLLEQKYQVAFMARELSENEIKFFKNKKIIPRVTPFATDAIAFIKNKNNNDTLIALKDVIDFMHGKPNSSVKGLVFDNPNSSTVRYIKEVAKVDTAPVEGVFSFKSNDEVIKFVSENEGMIGVVGVNWISQPKPEMSTYIDKINVLSVKGIEGTKYFSPSQYNLANDYYPLSRDLFVVNCQGVNGLGMGLASFVAGDIGQRIILKSGLLPYKTPGRKIMIRKKINNDKK